MVIEWNGMLCVVVRSSHVSDFILGYDQLSDVHCRTNFWLLVCDKAVACVKCMLSSKFTRYFNEIFEAKIHPAIGWCSIRQMIRPGVSPWQAGQAITSICSLNGFSLTRRGLQLTSPFQNHRDFIYYQQLRLALHIDRRVVGWMKYCATDKVLWGK